MILYKRPVALDIHKFNYKQVSKEEKTRKKENDTLIYWNIL